MTRAMPGRTGRSNGAGPTTGRGTPPGRSETTGQGRRGRLTRFGAALAVVVLIGAALVAADHTGPGAAVIGAAHRFLAYYAGVFSLVALSITVMVGLAATDRLVLAIRHRVLAQAIHRAMATTAMVFLAVHIAMKVVAGHSRVLDAIVPFLGTHRVVVVGLGTVASYLMILATWTGVARGRFAGTAHPGLWRALHVTTYACWIFAIVHGLMSGRPASTWVTVSYGGCVLLVGLGLLVRLCVTWGRHREVTQAHTAGTAKIKAIGGPGKAIPLARITDLSAPGSLEDEPTRGPAAGWDRPVPAGERASGGPLPGDPDAVDPALHAEYIEDIPVIVREPLQRRDPARDTPRHHDLPDTPRRHDPYDAPRREDVYGARHHGSSEPPDRDFSGAGFPGAPRHRDPSGAARRDDSPGVPRRRDPHGAPRRQDLVDLAPPGQEPGLDRVPEDVSDEEFWAFMRGGTGR